MNHVSVTETDKYKISCPSRNNVLIKNLIGIVSKFKILRFCYFRRINAFLFGHGVTGMYTFVKTLPTVHLCP